MEGNANDAATTERSVAASILVPFTANARCSSPRRASPFDVASPAPTKTATGSSSLAVVSVEVGISAASVAKASGGGSR